MSVKKILTEPNKILRQVSKPVEKVGEEEQKLMNDMLDTMYAAPGIGLAAIQIGVPKRIIVMDISRNENKKEPMYFVNPVIKNKNIQKSIYEEGCLSVPDQFAEIERPNSCEVEYLDYKGKKRSLKAEGLLATCIQHEIDHLNGVLMIDLVNDIQRSEVQSEVNKIKNESLAKIKRISSDKNFVL